jgi:hypothetical protein
MNFLVRAFGTANGCKCAMNKVDVGGHSSILSFLFKAEIRISRFTAAANQSTSGGECGFVAFVVCAFQHILFVVDMTPTSKQRYLPRPPVLWKYQPVAHGACRLFFVLQNMCSRTPVRFGGQARVQRKDIVPSSNSSDLLPSYSVEILSYSSAFPLC